MEILIIGGTGIVGTAAANKAAIEHEVTVLAPDFPQRDQFIPGVKFFCTGKGDPFFEPIVQSITPPKGWDCVVDIYSFSEEHARITSEVPSDQFIVFSTSLVYERSNTPDSIPSSQPIAETPPSGYASRKLDVERLWRSTNHNWTLLRPYHILGPNSYLGCLPFHNRDPYIVERINNEQQLNLVNDVQFNAIHPNDLAEIILRCIGNKNTFQKAYNAVNPKPILTADYFKEIAKQLNKPLNINRVPNTCNNGWALTAQNHLYDTSDLETDIQYTPNTSIETCIADSLRVHPPLMPAEETAVHQRMNIRPWPCEL
ncbi:MAG: NAD-dependent epimerase/dehydratase family protein [Candidatus Nanoarchaeia archaeon]